MLGRLRLRLRIAWRLVAMICAAVAAEGEEGMSMVLSSWHRKVILPSLCVMSSVGLAAALLGNFLGVRMGSGDL